MRTMHRNVRRTETLFPSEFVAHHSDQRLSFHILLWFGELINSASQYGRYRTKKENKHKRERGEKMEIICCKEKSAYVKRNNGKFELVRDKSRATQFGTGEAKRFITNQVPKKQRINYSVEEISPPVEFFKTLPPISKKQPSKVNKPKSIYDTNEIREQVIRLAKENAENLNTSLNGLTDKLRIQLVDVDNEILDYRHYIRNKATSLNSVQGYRAYKLHTDLERKREEIKKTLQLCVLAIQKAEELQGLLEKFDYEPYKPRTNMNFDELIKGCLKLN